MRMSTPNLRPPVIALASIAIAPFVPSCGGQVVENPILLADGGTGSPTDGEAQRCTYFDSPDPHINGSSECPSGLVCTAAFDTNVYPYDRCCPPNLTDRNNVPACYKPGGVGDGS